MFQSAWIGDIVAAARSNAIEPAGLLAVVEVESRGRAFEDDGRTPIFLFERHIFYNELLRRAPERLAAAVAQGLAHQGPRPGQYRDQATSAGKLQVLARARAVDEICADRSCSWGLGQVMGNNAESLGFSNVAAMLAALETSGVPAQIDLMVRFIKANRLAGPLANHDWAGFARRYNGAAFAKNAYDIKLAAAFAKWQQSLSLHPADLAVEPRQERQAPAPDLVKATPKPAPAASRDEAARLLAEAMAQRLRAPGLPQDARASAPVAVSSPIDRAIGGDAMVGTKSVVALLAYSILSVLQATGAAGTATGDTKTATGQILTMLIGGLGGLGVLSKGDRLTQLLGLIAAKPTGAANAAAAEPGIALAALADSIESERASNALK